MILAFIGPEYNITAFKAMLLFAGYAVEDDTDITAYVTWSGSPSTNTVEADFNSFIADPLFQDLILAEFPEYLDQNPIITNKASSFYKGSIPPVFHRGKVIYCQEGYVENFKELSNLDEKHDFIRVAWEIAEGNEVSVLSKARGSISGLWSFNTDQRKLYAYSGSRASGRIVDHPLFFIQVGDNSFYISTETLPLEFVGYLHYLEDPPKIQRIDKNTIMCFEWGMQPVRVKRIRRCKEEIKRPNFRKKKQT